jgi:NitT/TauT family transport system substrate-binding protein
MPWHFPPSGYGRDSTTELPARTSLTGLFNLVKPSKPWHGSVTEFLIDQILQRLRLVMPGACQSIDSLTVGNPRVTNPIIAAEVTKMHYRTIALLLVFTGSLPLFAAQAQDKKLDFFTISYASVSGTRAPLWIAKDNQLFEKYGLDGNLIYIASGVTSVNALLGGSVDIIAASGSSAVGAAARGAPLVVIASLGHIAYKLIAHPSITSVQGLKGKIIGSSRIGAGTDFALQRLLPKLGLIPGKDVTLIPTGISESDRRMLMLVQGKIDATLGTEDNLLQLASRGMKFSVLADLYEAGVYTTGSDIATSRQLLKQKPRQLKAFLMAVSEGIAVGRMQREQAFRVYRKYLKVEDPRMLESMYKNYLHGSIPARPFPKEEAIQNDIEDLSHTYAHLKGRKAGEFLDISLLKSLEDEGFFKKLYGK